MAGDLHALAPAILVGGRIAAPGSGLCEGRRGREQRGKRGESAGGEAHGHIPVANVTLTQRSAG